MADECKAVIGYTSYPNKRFNLSTEADYYNISSLIWQAAHECDDTDEVIAGACNIVFPRCLMGYSLELCRQSCLGKRVRKPTFRMHCVRLAFWQLSAAASCSHYVQRSLSRF